MKLNDDKCKLIVANHEYVSLTLGNESIEASSSVELFGIKLDKKFNFNEHVSAPNLEEEIKNYMH